MAKKMIIASVDKDEERVGVLLNDSLDEFYVERVQEQRIVGNVYLGRVTNIAAGIEAAFVDIGLGKDGFLYVDDVTSPALDDEEFEKERESNHHRGKRPRIKDLLKTNQQVLVQIVKEPISTKGARLTTHITFPGKYVVYMPFETHKGISKKIEDAQQRKRLREFLQKLTMPVPGGLIARTQSLYCNERDFLRELRYLGDLWRKVKGQSERQKAPALVWNDYDLVLRVVRDIFDAECDSMIIDSKDVFKRAMHLVKVIAPDLRPKLKYYQGQTPLFERYNVGKEIDNIYCRKVFLKTGGYLVFDETEGMVVIDVNSGSATRGHNLEETVFRVNKEAAVEIARQLKLRDVGGIIVIDFIDMEVREHRDSVLDIFKTALRHDKAKLNVLGISRIGLVEMTRQRMRRSLQSLSYQSCPYCAGRGLVKSVQTVAITAMRDLEAKLKSNRGKNIELHLHPDVTKHMAESYREPVKRLSRMYRSKISVYSEQKFHIEGIELVVR